MEKIKCMECGKNITYLQQVFHQGGFYCMDCAISLGLDFNEDDDETPEGCGGDWPNCKSSCPLFDD